MIGPSAALLFARRGTCLARCLSVKINKIAIDVSQFPQHLQQYAPGLRRALLSTLFLYHISTGLYPSALGCAWVVVLSRKLPSIWGWAFLIFFCARKKKHWVRVSSSKVPISLLLSVGAAYFPFLARIHFLVGEGVFYKRGYCGLGGCCCLSPFGEGGGCIFLGSLLKGVAPVCCMIARLDWWGYSWALAINWDMWFSCLYSGAHFEGGLAGK